MKPDLEAQRQLLKRIRNHEISPEQGIALLKAKPPEPAPEAKVEAKPDPVSKRREMLRRIRSGDLMGLAGMLLEVDGAVAVDTGLGHLAAALDVPTVSLYGPTSTHLIGAYGRNQVHIQSPVSQEDTDDPVAMMNAIGAEQVWRELQGILPGDQ